MLTREDKQWISDLLDERLQKVETRMLTEFHKWAQPVVGRLGSHTEALRTLDLELEALQRRVEKLENPTS